MSGFDAVASSAVRRAAAGVVTSSPVSPPIRTRNADHSVLIAIAAMTAAPRRPNVTRRGSSSSTAPAPAAPASPAAVGARSLPAAHVSASPAVVRAWARANGWDVGERGRLPAEVTDAYRRAHDPLGSS